MRWIGICIAAAAAVCTGAASAKPALCFATDEGEYDCEFRSLDSDGSFEISASGKPTYSLWMDRPGVAAGFVNFGDRNISLPGFYERRSDDLGCWANEDTDTVICAW